MSTVATRPVYWTVRRELWENRSIYLAPAIVGGLEIVSMLISTVNSHVKFDAVGDIGGDEAQFALAGIYGALGFPILITALIVAAFYCLDTLYSERRDRSILFWKSLPVSDTATVLSKALIPFAILPVITLAVICVVQIAGLLVSVGLFRANGADTAILWASVPVATMPIALAYSLAVMSLWYAPLYGWLFLVSAFAKRKAILWALLPPLAAGIAEMVAFHTHYVPDLMKDRFLGFVGAAFDIQSPRHFIFGLDKLTPGGFLGSLDMWAGLAVAALFFAAAIQLRRYRDAS